MASTRFTLSTQDTNKWKTNLLRFLAPVGVIYLGFVMTQIQTGGFQLSDFTPNNFTQGAIVLYCLNGIFDLLRKFVAGK